MDSQERIKELFSKARTHKQEAYTQQSQLDRMSPGFESSTLIEQQRQAVAQHRQMAMVNFLDCIAEMIYAEMNGYTEVDSNSPVE